MTTSALIVSMLLSQFFTPVCKQGQDCSVNNINAVTVTADGGVFRTVQLLGFSPPVTCSAANKGLLQSYDLAGVGSPSLLSCDGQNANIVSQTLAGSKLADITSRTIASGVITTGNALLGAGILNYAPTPAAVTANVRVVDYITTSCGVVGVGAGDVTIALRKLTGAGAPADICTVTRACTAAILTPTVSSCTNNAVSSVISGFGSALYGTTIDVSACGTPPADCVVHHEVYQN